MTQASESPGRRNLVCGMISASLIGTALFARAAMPKPIIESAADIPSLEALIPTKFGGWSIDRNVVPLEVAPDVAKTLSTIYDKTLSRTYVNSSGQRIMLSLAYGANQSRALQLHKPEVCYVAQGFRINSLEKSDLTLNNVAVPVMRMVAEQGARVEPITYWMRIGDSVARGWYEQNMARFNYGLKGAIPDGLLFRISNISQDPVSSYELQDLFVRDLLLALDDAGRHMVLGAPARASASS